VLTYLWWCTYSIIVLVLAVTYKFLVFWRSCGRGRAVTAVHLPCSTAGTGHRRVHAAAVGRGGGLPGTTVHFSVFFIFFKIDDQKVGRSGLPCWPIEICMALLEGRYRVGCAGTCGRTQIPSSLKYPRARATSNRYSSSQRHHTQL